MLRFVPLPCIGQGRMHSRRTFRANREAVVEIPPQPLQLCLKCYSAVHRTGV